MERNAEAQWARFAGAIVALGTTLLLACTAEVVPGGGAGGIGAGGIGAGGIGAGGIGAGAIGGGGPGGSGGCVFAPPEWGDPEWGSLACIQPSNFIIGISGSLTAPDVVELAISWCGCMAALCVYYGEVSGLAVEVPPELGTLLAPVPTDCSGGPPTATIQLAAGAAEGDFAVTGQISGLDDCTQPLTCPIDNTYHLTVGADGVQLTRVAP